jgi:hypothetical protein
MDAVLLQYLCDCTARYSVIKVSQSALYSGIAPTGILLSHPDDQLPDLLHHTGPTDTLVWVSPFNGNQFAVPREDRTRCHNGGDLAQHLPSQRFSFCRQPAALGVGTTKASPAGLELLFQYPVLFYQVRDDRRLFSPDPAGKRGQEELKMDGLNHSGSITAVW